VQLHQAVNTAAGAVGGAFWGTLIGSVFQPTAGRRRGRNFGALSGKFTDIGINDQFIKDLSGTITPGSAALFVLVRRSTPDKVLEGLKPFTGKGRVLQTSLTKDKETNCAGIRRRGEAHPNRDLGGPSDSGLTLRGCRAYHGPGVFQPCTSLASGAMNLSYVQRRDRALIADTIGGAWTVRPNAGATATRSWRVISSDATVREPPPRGRSRCPRADRTPVQRRPRRRLERNRAEWMITQYAAAKVGKSS
jgi:uncharacterized membrane protein